MKNKLQVFLILICLLATSNLFSLDKLTILPPNQKIGRTSQVLSNTVMIRLKSDNSKGKGLSLLTQSENFTYIHPILKPEMVISQNSKKMAMLLSSNKHIKINEVLKAEEPLLRTYIIQYEGDMSPEEYCRKLLKDPAIEIAEPYHVPQLLGYKPNDAKIDMQSGLSETQAYDAWEIEKGSPDIVIGISDSGVLPTHEDLVDAIVVNENEIPNNDIDDDNNGYIDDYLGYNFNHPVDGQGWGNTDPNDPHGTEVAGIAAATTDNNLGVAGFGFNSSILPMMITTMGSQGAYPVYGYESILFAVVRGCQVLNMSWGGTQAFSQIEQSIVDYAIANDVALVAATGNLTYGESYISTYYPAGYNGVLGVAQTQDDLIKVGACAIGSSCDILAPAYLYSTTSSSDNAYYDKLAGTSFACPAVSGAVALVRNHFPELSAMQCLELVRQQSDNINEQNSYYNFMGLFPNRLNLYKPLVCEPFSFPGIRPMEIILQDNNGKIRKTFSPGEEINISIKARNYLGAAENLRFVISMSFNPRNMECFDYIVNETPKTNINAESDFEIGTFKIKPIEDEPNKVVMRVDIYGDNGYHDFFKFDMVPTADFATFSNNQIEFSMLNDGTFGFNSNNNDEPLGSGFTYKNHGNQIYDAQSGLIACENMIKVGYSYNDSYRFDVVQKFSESEYKNVGIVESPVGSYVREMGMQIKQTAGFINVNAKSGYIDIEMKALKDLSNPAVGYIFDFDIMSNSGDNRTFYLSKAIPDEFVGKASAQAAICAADEKTPWIAAGCISHEIGAVPAAAGLNTEITWQLQSSEIVRALTTGTTWQNEQVDDISVVVGMAYPGTVKKDEVRKCRICIAAGNTEEEMIDELQKCLGIKASGVIDENSTTLLYPNPANQTLNIKTDGSIAHIEIYDIFGRKLLGAFSTDSIDISTLSIGTYYVRITNDLYSKTETLKVIR